MTNEAREMTRAEWIRSLGAAANRWVRIDSRCELPEVDKVCLMSYAKGLWSVAVVDEHGIWWHEDGDEVEEPEYYALINPPTEDPHA